MQIKITKNNKKTTKTVLCPLLFGSQLSFLEREHRLLNVVPVVHRQQRLP
jgi:hypothetical protein